MRKKRVEKQRADFLQWAENNAVFLSDFDGETVDIEVLSFLDEQLSDKRVAYLVEMNHFIHEKYDFRLLFIRYLVSRGFRVIGEELSWTDGMHVDRYLSTGDPKHLDHVTTYGYKGDIRSDRDDSATGILSNTGEYPEAELRGEQVRFAEALRRLNKRQAQEARLRFFGFDVDYVPGGAYGDLKGWLERRKDDSHVAEILQVLSIVPDETIQQEIERLDRARVLMETHIFHLKGVLTSTIYGAIDHSLRTLKESFAYVRVANPAEDYDVLNEAMAMRESIMHRNVAYVLEQIESDEKVILMAGSLHLAKDDSLIHTPGTGAGPGGNGKVPSIGHYINQVLAPDQVFSVWMLYNHGKDLQPFPELDRDLTSTPGSLNDLMNHVGTGADYILPTITDDPEAGLIAQEMDIVQMYNQVFRTTVSKQADAIFFTPKVSPIRL